ncbi:MAG: hypothetical protein RLZZ337_316 [Bacteroidota bacterium]
MAFLTSMAMAQSGTQSPYSSSGLGEFKFNGFAQHKALGGASRAQVSINNFSVLNPASYANLKFTVYDVGLNASFGTLKTTDQEAKTASGNLNYFAMAFPFNTAKPMALSFGTYQYSDVGYEIKNAVSTDTPSYYNLFRGSGGLNRVYAGYAVSPLKNWNIGLNASFIFGNIQALSAKIYPNTDDYFSFSDETYTSYSGFDFDFGTQYSVQNNIRIKQKIKGDTTGVKRVKTVTLKHTLGATFNTQTTLKGDGYRYAETFFGRKFDAGTLTSIDTLIFEDNKKSTSVKPSSFGLAYALTNGEKWGITAEIEQNQWSDVTNQANGNLFFDNVKYAFGFSFVPSTRYEEPKEFLKKVRYSVGFRNEQLYYNFFGEQINEVGISFGLGLPVIKSVRIEEEKLPVVSRVNITAEYIKRGTTNNGLIEENYFNLTLGLNLNDKWFTKRKYR